MPFVDRQHGPWSTTAAFNDWYNPIYASPSDYCSASNHSDLRDRQQRFYYGKIVVIVSMKVHYSNNQDLFRVGLEDAKQMIFSYNFLESKVGRSGLTFLTRYGWRCMREVESRRTKVWHYLKHDFLFRISSEYGNVSIYSFGFRTISKPVSVLDRFFPKLNVSPIWKCQNPFPVYYLLHEPFRYSLIGKEYMEWNFSIRRRALILVRLWWRLYDLRSNRA